MMISTFYPLLTFPTELSLLTLWKYYLMNRVGGVEGKESLRVGECEEKDCQEGKRTQEVDKQVVLIKITSKLKSEK